MCLAAFAATAAADCDEIRIIAHTKDTYLESGLWEDLGLQKPEDLAAADNSDNSDNSNGIDSDSFEFDSDSEDELEVTM